MRLKKSFWVGRPKMDFLKSTKRTPFGSAEGQIPKERVFVKIDLKNPYTTKVKLYFYGLKESVFSYYKPARLLYSLHMRLKTYDYVIRLCFLGKNLPVNPHEKLFG